MRINISTRNDLTLSGSMERFVQQKVGKLNRYFGDDIEAQVRLGFEHNRFSCEITIPLTGEILRAEEISNDMYFSIDSAMSKLERQLRKYRTRIAKRMKTGAEPIEAYAPVEEEQVAQLVRTKHFAVASMDVDEAISQMEMLGHTFFLFRDSKTEKICVVYTRTDGNYGLLIPD